jgi:stage V sporulation protein G
MGITITDVRIKRYEDQTRKTKAVASITINNAFVIHDIKIIESEKGLFIAMPSKKGPDDQFKYIAHPINTETRNMIQQIIIDKYNEA